MLARTKLLLAVLFAVTLGCRSSTSDPTLDSDWAGPPLTIEMETSLHPEQPSGALELSQQRFDPGPLENFDFSDPNQFHRLTLDECIEMALRDSQVIRQLGGMTLRSPAQMKTADDPALTYTDPRFGEEAALAEFDAEFSNQFLYQNNDRAYNSQFIGNSGIFQQKLATNETSLRKTSATGGEFQLNHSIEFDYNNFTQNRFSNDMAYDTYLGAEFRQPLLQGAGVWFNRIAGPGNQPGVNNGVLIARTNTDITLADFELGIRDLVSEVENAYWDLYFAYRDLEAKVEARNGAYEIWRRLNAEADDKSSTQLFQAKEQYYLFASRVQDAIYGQLNDGTRTNNGSSAGTFRATPGVRTAERRLRLLTGQPVNDSLLLVPADSPVEAAVKFDWEQIKTDALAERTELRRQRWVVKREELAYLANKNHLMPRLDLIGRYRVRGFGNDLFGSDGFDPVAAKNEPIGFQDGSDAFATFLNGDLQEWELGMDLNIPIGFRRAFSAVRNAELSVNRERKILREQEREIIYGLSNAVGELERATKLLEVNAQRLEASRQQYTAIQVAFNQDNTTIDLVLESQRRVIDAKVDYFKSQVEFMLAVKSVHFEKGTVLRYHNVALTENGWQTSDYRQAMELAASRRRPLNYSLPGLMVSQPLDEETLTYFETEMLEPQSVTEPAANLSAAPAAGAEETPVAAAGEAAAEAPARGEESTELIEVDSQLLTELATKMQAEQDRRNQSRIQNGGLQDRISAAVARSSSRVGRWIRPAGESAEDAHVAEVVDQWMEQQVSASQEPAEVAAEASGELLSADRIEDSLPAATTGVAPGVTAEPATAVTSAAAAVPIVVPPQALPPAQPQVPPAESAPLETAGTQPPPQQPQETSSRRRR